MIKETEDDPLAPHTWYKWKITSESAGWKLDYDDMANMDDSI